MIVFAETHSEGLVGDYARFLNQRIGIDVPVVVRIPRSFSKETRALHQTENGTWRLEDRTIEIMGPWYLVALVLSEGGRHKFKGSAEQEREIVLQVRMAHLVMLTEAYLEHAERCGKPVDLKGDTPMMFGTRLMLEWLAGDTEKLAKKLPA